MMKIESYILLPGYIIKDINNIDISNFINVKEGQLLENETLDYDYIEGALVINYNNKNILDFKYWDLIDQLWLYFVDAIKKLKEDSISEFSFPDQSLKIKLEKKDKELFLYVGEDLTKFNFQEFIKQMIFSAYDFFTYLIKIFPEEKDAIKYQQDYIEEVRRLYKL